MHEYVVNPLLFEVAKGVDRDVCQKRKELKLIDGKLRMAAALHALKNIGMAYPLECQSKFVWNPTQLSVDFMELRDFNAESDQFAGAVFQNSRFS